MAYHFEARTPCHFEARIPALLIYPVGYIHLKVFYGEVYQVLTSFQL